MLGDFRGASEQRDGPLPIERPGAQEGVVSLFGKHRRGRDLVDVAGLLLRDRKMQLIARATERHGDLDAT
jgi:hypothetical protein